MARIVPVYTISRINENNPVERISKAVFEDSETGDVLEGDTHKEANPYAPKSGKTRETPEYKFKTSEGRIVNRKTAYNIAKKANQLKRQTKRKILHSRNIKYATS